MTLDTWSDEIDHDEQPRERRRWPLVVGASLLALVAAYVAAAFLLGDRVPRGTTVAGVAVGGQDAATARATLARALGGASAEPIVLTSPAGEVAMSPEELGVGIDVDETVAGLVGFSLAPVDLWHHLAGGSDEPAAVTVDEDAFGAALEDARGELDAEPVEGSLSLEGGTATLTEPRTGTTTDVEGTVAAVRRWWPAEGTVEVAAASVEPKVSADELRRVKAEFADVAVSAPVTVTAGETSFTLEPKAFVPAIVLEADESGTIVPRADEKKLAEVVRAAARKADAEVEAKDAVVTFSGRTPTVKAHVPGVALDDASLQAQVWKAISTPTRTATVATKKVEPGFTTAAAKATLPKEKISSFTTYYKPGQARVRNIKLASRVLDGTYIPPGEQFSMNAVLGERTAGKGYVEAGIIRNGRAAESVGGGISQVSTTIFNAAFFAGVQLDAWTPHYYYISRYPEGREATISWPDLHNKFTNTTDGGILMQVAATDTSITVSFWGTKKYDVTATKSDRYDVVQPKRYTDDDPDCINQSPVVGFKVDVGRILKQGGKVVKTEKFTTNYRPEDDVTCTNAR
ncbi:VanW family protein [Fodinibacter luteus]|uniref:VanW family protein n=1 Tax=Fodinibacter luteus TaxID=552064 RepID=A0ABP8KPU5_9MICO